MRFGLHSLPAGLIPDIRWTRSSAGRGACFIWFRPCAPGLAFSEFKVRPQTLRVRNRQTMRRTFIDPMSDFQNQGVRSRPVVSSTAGRIVVAMDDKRRQPGCAGSSWRKSVSVKDKNRWQMQHDPWSSIDRPSSVSTNSSFDRYLMGRRPEKGRRACEILVDALNQERPIRRSSLESRPGDAIGVVVCL